ELGQRLRAERGALAGGAVEDDLSAAVGDDALDPRLEAAARDVDGGRQMALLPLVVATHVDEERVLERLRIARVDLGDLGLDLAEELAVRLHGFKKDSSGSQGVRATFDDECRRGSAYCSRSPPRVSSRRGSWSGGRSRRARIRHSATRSGGSPACPGSCRRRPRSRSPPRSAPRRPGAPPRWT